MSNLQENVALALINVSRGDLPPLTKFEHPQNDEECWLEQAQAAIDTICEALLSDDVVEPYIKEVILKQNIISMLPIVSQETFRIKLLVKLLQGDFNEN